MGEEPGIDDLLKHLYLRDNELEEVVIDAEESKEYQMAARWLAIAKVPTNVTFSAEAGR
jgi:hypothetical protein